MLITMSPEDQNKKIFQTNPGPRYALLLTIIAIGAGLSVFVFSTLRSWESRAARLYFIQMAEERYASLTREIELDLHALEATRALYGVTDRVNGLAFRNFVKPLSHNRPTIQALEWIPRVVKSQREDYEKAARKEGFRNFQIREREPTGRMVRSHDREEFFPVYFVEPYRGNETALGFDLASNPARKISLEQARDTGEAVATGRITLVQETANQFGFLVFAPIYKKDAPLYSIEARRKNLVGFVLGVFRIGGLLENAFEGLNPQDINLFLYDQFGPEKERFLSFYSFRERKSTTSSKDDEDDSLDIHPGYLKTIDLAGRQWLVLFKPTRHFATTQRTWQPWGALIIGLFFTFLLTGYLFGNIRRTQSIEKLVTERTEQLSLTNKSLEREVAIRTQTEKELKKARDGLEDEVKRRTIELTIANQNLQDEITERKRAAQALFDSEQRYRNLVDNVPDVIFTLALDGTIDSINPAFERLTGWPRSEWLGEQFSPLLHPDDLSGSLELFRRVLSGEKMPPFQSRAQKKSGDYLVAEFIGTPQFRDGAVTGILGVARDITEIRQAEQALEERERELTTILQTALDGFFIVDMQGKLLEVNEAYCVIFGFTREELLKMSIRDVEGVETEQETVARIQKVRREGYDHFETQHRRKDGQLIDLDISVKFMDFGGGRTFCFCRDITEQKKSERALQQSEEAARRLAQENAVIAEIGRIVSSSLNVEDVYGLFAETVHKVIPFDRISITAINQTDRTGKMAYAWGSEVQHRKQGEVFSLTGLFYEEIIAKRSGILAQEQDERALAKRYPGLMGFQAGFRSMISVPLISRNDVIGVLHLRSFEPNVYTESDLRLVERVGNQIAGAIANAQLFAERKQVEDALRESENKFKDLYDNAPLGYHEYDNEGRITNVNRTELEMLGYTAEEMIGKPVWEFNVEPDIAREKILAKLGGTLTASGKLEPTYRRKNGTLITILIEEKLLLDDKQAIKGVRCIVQDITDRKRAEEALKKSEKEAKRLSQENAGVAEIGRIISSTLNIEEVYGRFAGEVRKLISIDRITFSSINPDGNSATITYVWGPKVKNRNRGDVFPLKGTLVETAVTRRSGILILMENEEAVEKNYPGLLNTFRTGFRSLISVPLISKDRIIGVLILHSLDKNAYTDLDLALAQRVANQIAGAIANAQLYDERKRAEEALRRSEERYRTLAESAEDAIFIIDPEGHLQYINEIGASRLRPNGGKIVGENLSEILPEKAAERQRLALRTVLESRKTVLHEINMVLPTGEMYSEVRLIPIFAKGEEIQSVMGVARDITERKRAEEALRESEEKYRGVAERGNDGIAIIQEGRFKYINQRLSAMVGYTVDDVVGTFFNEYIWPEELSKVVDIYKRRTAGEDVAQIYETAIRHRDGHKVEIELNAGLITYEGKTADLVFIRDITQRKQLQIQLSQAQKLESIGQLAAGIAHEINTPIQYVGDNTRFLQGCQKEIFGLIEKYHHMLTLAKEAGVSWELISEIEKSEENTDLEYLSEEVPKAIQQSLEGVDRVAKIVRAMKEFSHPGIKEKTVVDLNKAIETTITIARNEWKYVSEMVTDLDPNLPLVLCLPDDFNQVILNIIVNAAHAIAGVVGDGSKGKGTITVKTKSEDNWVEIRISDTGAGIPEEVRGRIFDPFFTTKEVGKGTGQGLTISHSIIVKKHGGTLTFETEEGTGTTFIIRLPVEPETDLQRDRG